MEAAPRIDELAGKLASGISMNFPGTTANRERLIEWFGTLSELDATSGVFDRLQLSAANVAEAIRYIVVPGGPGFDAITGSIADLVHYLDIGSMSAEEFAYWQRQVWRYSPEAAQEMSRQRREIETLARQEDTLAESATHTGLTLGDMARQTLSAGNAARAAARDVETLGEAVWA
jgi:hypothetical protein